LEGYIPLARSNTFMNILLKHVPFRKPLLAGSVATAIPAGKPHLCFWSLL
jgi:hypothetical protein